MHIGHGARVKHTGGEPLPEDHTRGCGTLLVDELDAVNPNNSANTVTWNAYGDNNFGANPFNQGNSTNASCSSGYISTCVFGSWSTVAAMVADGIWSTANAVAHRLHLWLICRLQRRHHCLQHYCCLPPASASWVSLGCVGSGRPLPSPCDWTRVSMQHRAPAMWPELFIFARLQSRS